MPKMSVHRTRTLSTSASLRAWTIQEAAELYHLPRWSKGFFALNDQGHVEVRPRGADGPAVDLKALMDDLVRRGISPPILIRFPDILRTRIERINNAFQDAIASRGYRGRYIAVYPIKVNQQKHVVEEIVQFGAPYGTGLEVGSKPELLAGLGMLEAAESPIICNGYKDRSYVDMVLLASKLGKTIIPVVEKPGELELILRRARELDVRPVLGMRLKLTARGAGRWQESAGDRSKFGLTVTDVVNVLETLRSADMLDCLQLIHFHMGSQITDIRSITDATDEASRVYVEIARAGAGLKYLDVGGGLAVDYDGSSSNFQSSANYTLAEYAENVVAVIAEACERAEVPHPTILTECGRAITAYYSVLICNVLGATEMAPGRVPASLPPDSPKLIEDMLRAYRGVSRKNFQQAYHDALDYREESLSLFKHGILTLEHRGLCESIFWATCRRILQVLREQDADYIPEELEKLEAAMADIYFCNFSAFQSIPDSWAIGHLFPILPIHRLNEPPTRRAVLADLTCDSDGKVDRFIDLRDVKEVLELHPLRNGEPYYIGIFMVGAYQEILGDMHNLFGDTNAVHVHVEDDGEYRIDHVVAGDRVDEVLRYVQFSAEDLVARMRRMVELAVREKRLTIEQSAALLARYEQGLTDYTYLNR
jgi:arginine decarboxylase